MVPLPMTISFLFLFKFEHTTTCFANSSAVRADKDLSQKPGISQENYQSCLVIKYFVTLNFLKKLVRISSKVFLLVFETSHLKKKAKTLCMRDSLYRIINFHTVERNQSPILVKRSGTLTKSLKRFPFLDSGEYNRQQEA